MPPVASDPTKNTGIGKNVFGIYIAMQKSVKKE